MKYTIMGFLQSKLIEYGMDTVDAAVLRYFIDFKDSGSMIMKVINGEPYYWLKYKELLADIPVINIRNKDVLRRRLKRMVESEVLKTECIKSGGSYSFYAIGSNYKYLISGKVIEGTTQKSDGCDSKVAEGTTQKSDGCNSKVVEGTTQKSDGYDPKVATNNPSTNNPSTKDIYTQILDHLNIKAGTKYRASTKKTRQLIDALVKEKYSLEDFLTVIDKKSEGWIGTEYEPYLRPETLFNSTKFEGYLNQKTRSKKTEIKKDNRDSFNNFEGRDYTSGQISDIEKKLLGWRKRDDENNRPDGPAKD